MNRNEIMLIELLCQQSDWITAANISSALCCSVRSVKNYIARINGNAKDLILSSRNGYKLQDKQRALDLLSAASDALPQNVRERRSWLLCKLLLSNNRFSIEELAKELCISYYTLQTMMNGLKLQLSNYDLTLKTKNDCVWISGLEKNKKNMLIDMVYEEIPDFYSNTSLLQFYLPHMNLSMIREIVDSAFMGYHYFIDDFSKLYISLYIAITLEQRLIDPDGSKKPYELEETARPSSPNVTPDIQEIVERIQTEIQNYVQISLSPLDAHDLAVLLTTRTRAKEGEPDTSLHTPSLMDKIQDRVKHIFHTDLSNINFLTMMMAHLQSMQVRLENQFTLKNPHLNTIKESYPYIYEIAVVVADVFTKETGYVVPEDEIGYLALYIGITLDYQKNIEYKVKAILYCPQYYSVRTSLAEKISSIFDNKMILTNVITALNDLLQCADYDFIISTVPINLEGKPTKYVSLYIKSDEIVAINDEINTQYHLKMQHLFQEKLSILFKRDLFFYNPAFQSKEEALSYFSEKLYENGYVEQDFADKLFERENICSSAFTNIALPHPLEMCAKKSAIVTAIVPGGMPWGNNSTVNLVLVLAICPEDDLLFHDIFSFITEFIFNKKNFQMLMNVRTYDEFIQILTSFFPE